MKHRILRRLGLADDFARGNRAAGTARCTALKRTYGVVHVGAVERAGWKEDWFVGEVAAADASEALRLARAKWPGRTLVLIDDDGRRVGG